MVVQGQLENDNLEHSSHIGIQNASHCCVSRNPGVVTGGITTRGFNDGSEQGYPVLLTLSTQQVSDIVYFDEEILKPKGSKLPADCEMPCHEESSDRLEAIRQVCANYYLEDYSDEKVWIHQRFLPCVRYAIVMHIPIDCVSSNCAQP